MVRNSASTLSDSDIEAIQTKILEKESIDGVIHLETIEIRFHIRQTFIIAHISPKGSFDPTAVDHLVITEEGIANKQNEVIRFQNQLSSTDFYPLSLPENLSQAELFMRYTHILKIYRLAAELRKYEKPEIQEIQQMMENIIRKLLDLYNYIDADNLIQSDASPSITKVTQGF